MKKSNPMKSATGSADISAACTEAAGFADIGKVSRGLNMVFKGYSLVFDALAEQAEQFGAMPPELRKMSAQEAMISTNAGEPQISAEVEPVPQTDVDLPPAPSDDDAPPFEVDSAPAEAKPHAAKAETGKAEKAMTKSEFVYELRNFSNANPDKRPQVKGVLEKFGFPSVSAVTADKYAEIWQAVQSL